MSPQDIRAPARPPCGRRLYLTGDERTAFRSGGQGAAPGADAVQRAGPQRRLWLWTRDHAWRRVKAVLRAAGIEDGPHATAEGLRHGYGVRTR